MSDINLAFEDCEAVEAADLSPHYKLAVASVITSLRYLQRLSSELGKPIEEITCDEIIKVFKAEEIKNTMFVAY